LAAQAGRMVACRGWERLGFARVADYSLERLGMSGRELLDLAHVDSALRELPRVELALVAGTLSWTRARLLARVATSEDETHWISLARSRTVRELSREVRAIDVGSVEHGGAAPDGEAPDEGDGDVDFRGVGVVVRCSPEVNAKWQLAWRLASRVSGESLPRWACMEAVVAEVLSALPLDPDAVEPQGDGVAPPTAPHSRGSPKRRVVDPLEVDLAADPFALDARLRRAVAREQRLEARMGPLLLRVAEARLYRTRGFANLDHYARERLGLSPRKARALLRIERTARRCPELRRSYRAGRLSWVRAEALVPVLAVAARRAAVWVRRAERMTVRGLRDAIDAALLRAERGAELRARADARPQDPHQNPADLQTGARPTRPRETSRFFFRAPPEVARLIRATVCTLRRRLELASDGEAFGAMFDHVFEAWGARRRVRSAQQVFARDGWRCTAPGCSSLRNLHDHHIRFRSAGGSDALSNRTTLCAWHHLRGVHAGLVRCTGTAPRRLRFELGVRRGSPPLGVYVGGIAAGA